MRVDLESKVYVYALPGGDVRVMRDITLNDGLVGDMVITQALNDRGMWCHAGENSRPGIGEHLSVDDPHGNRSNE